MLPLNADGGAAAFSAIIGLSTIGFQLSYGIPVFLKLVCQPKSFPTRNALGEPLPYQVSDQQLFQIFIRNI
jgi:hypothetical protein